MRACSILIAAAATAAVVLATEAQAQEPKPPLVGVEVLPNAGDSHTPVVVKVHRFDGLASVYSRRLAVGLTANGERNRADGMTAAHRTLPFGTLVRVTNIRNGESAVVRINDRGPFVAKRVIDLSPAAAKRLRVSGIAPVSLTVVDER